MEKKNKSTEVILKRQEYLTFEVEASLKKFCDGVIYFDQFGNTRHYYLLVMVNKIRERIYVQLNEEKEIVLRPGWELTRKLERSKAGKLMSTGFNTQQKNISLALTTLIEYIRQNKVTNKCTN